MRPWTVEDLSAFHAIFGDPRVIWWGKGKSSVEESKRALQRTVAEQGEPLRGLGRFAVVERSSGRVVGNVILRPAGFAQGIEVGYHLAHASWGRGFATEAARAALAHGFEGVGLKRIIAAVALVNERSLRVMAKLPMRATRELEHGGLRHRLFECLGSAWPG